LFTMNFWSGNQAIVEGALSVGAKFFGGYPITPASEIMEMWAKKASDEDENLNFLQAEDELAAVHHVIGAVISGTPAFTATSGPGLSLMQEGLGLAFVYGAPIVVVDVMRSGPSTGKPTRAGQGEIFASRYGSHGDICPFVFYPTSVKECYDYTIKAFQAAWDHQVPVVLLSDAYLAHMQEKVSRHSELVSESKSRILKRVQDDKGKVQDEEISHFSGLTDRQANAQKIEKIKDVADENYRDYNLWGNENSDTLLVGLGSMARALRGFEDDYQIYAPVRIWPFLDREIKKIAENKKRVIVVEMNEGQYVREVERAVGDKVEFLSWREETIDIKKFKKMINDK
jgi:2-oxoglutarate/2-oxoacid ferredoxin oxidoreductase subunit alpha